MKEKAEVQEEWLIERTSEFRMPVQLKSLIYTLFYA